MTATTVLVATVAAAGWGAFAVAVGLIRKRRRRERKREAELLERLGGGLAHELKNPLGALNLNVGLLEEELESSNALKDGSRARLATIKREYRRLETVLNGFLRYASRRQLSMSSVDINPLVEELLTFVKPEFHRRGVELVEEVSRDPLVCSIDAALFKQALLNVLLNASEATPAGGKVHTMTSGDEREAAVTVSDTGVGISREDVAHVFEAYFTTKNTGTGLGLAITRKIVEDHGGRVSIESTPGKGTSITLIFPRKGPSPAGAR